MAAGPRSHGPRPLPIGWMVLALAGVLYLAGSNIGSGWVIILTASLVGALLLDLVTVWRVHRRTELRLYPAATATTTEPVGWRAEVQRPDLGTTLQLADDGGGSRTVVRAGVATVRATTSLRRGHHGEAIAVARTVGPLGLVHAVRRHAEPASTWCRPGVQHADGRVRAITATTGGDARRRIRDDEEVRGVREFTSSDARRSVHWRATARQGRLMVRELDAPHGAPLRLALAGGAWSQKSLDLATEVVASLATTAERRGHAVEVEADGAVLPWGDEAAHLLAALPPAVGIPSRPLATGSRQATMLLGPGPDGSVSADGVLLADAEKVAQWLRTG